jgi:hypothetical protein
MVNGACLGLIINNEEGWDEVEDTFGLKKLDMDYFIEG